MKVDALWHYQFKKFIVQFGRYILVTVAITTLIMLLITMNWGWVFYVEIIWPILQSLTLGSFIIWLMYLMLDMVKQWLFLFEAGYSRQRLFKQSLVLDLLFSVSWSLLIYLSGLSSNIRYFWTFSYYYYYFADYAKTLPAGMPRFVGNYLLIFELVVLILTIATFYGIVTVKYRQGVAAVILMISGLLPLLISNLASKLPKFQLLINGLIGYNTSGPDQPVPLLVTGGIFISLLWLINWLLWQRFEGERVIDLD